MWSTTEIVHFPSTHPTCPSTCWPIRQTQSNPDFSACECGPAALRGSCEAASEWRTVSFLTVFSDWCWTHQKDSGRLRLSCRSQLLGCTKKKITTGLFFFFSSTATGPCVHVRAVCLTWLLRWMAHTVLSGLNWFDQKEDIFMDHVVRLQGCGPHL